MASPPSPCVPATLTIAPGQGAVAADLHQVEPQEEGEREGDDAAAQAPRAQGPARVGAQRLGAGLGQGGAPPLQLVLN